MAKLKLKSRSSRRKRIILFVCLALVLAVGVIAAILLVQNKKHGEQINHISISTRGDIEYYLDEELDTTGLSVQVILNNGSYYFVTAEELTVTGFDSSKVNDNLVLTVSYQGFSDTYTVAIKAFAKPKPVIDHIEVKGYKETYTWAEWQSSWIDLNGMYIELHYTDGSTDKVFVNSTHDIEGLGKINSPDTHKLTVYYNDYENGILYDATFSITITN